MNHVGNIVPVILCGGSGRRLWPLSTKKRPKPFIRDINGQSFLQKTLVRTRGMKPPIIVCNENHKDMVRRDIGEGVILLEPCRRNTAPAIVAAAHFIRDHYGDDTPMMVMPSDHAMDDACALIRACESLIPVLDQKTIAVFGVSPHYPAIRYGYIHSTGEFGASTSPRPVQKFVEKPDRTHAQSYLAQGGWLWNSGLFLMQAQAVLDMAHIYTPDVFHATRDAVTERAQVEFGVYMLSSAFAAAPSISIDVAIMEQTDRAVVVPLNTGWSDLGTWPALMGAVCRAVLKVHRTMA